jgi:hypothetical protein
VGSRAARTYGTGAPEALSTPKAATAISAGAAQAQEAQPPAADAAHEGSEKVWQLERALPVLRDVSRAWMDACLPAAQKHLREARSALAAWLARALAVRGWMGEQLAVVREWFSAQRGRTAAFRRLRRAKSRATAPAPRIQRTQRGPGRSAPRGVKPRYQRLVALVLAAGGVGLGVYALAPRSGADRIRIQTVAPPAPQETVFTEPAQEQEAPAAVVAEATAAPALEAAPAEVAEDVSAAAEPLRFGEASVPHGRTFSLRMNGPIVSVEGEPREDGFTVKVPSRLALDKASPIASSHRAVQRAMILNRGDYAELTIDFVPGLRPKYQVVANGTALEVTLERM